MILLIFKDGIFMEKMHKQGKFGLSTTIAMIIGIVIGSGIFFKTPEIIKATNGNILHGTIAFVLAALSIIFGGLTISQFTKKENGIGGLIAYAESAYGQKLAFYVGWFQTVIYYPSITAVVGWVAANYIFALFGYPNLITQGKFNIYIWPFTIVIIVFFFLLNIFKTRNAGIFQNISMYSKITALIVFGICGFLFGNPSYIAESVTLPSNTTNILVALVAIAFAFDGWMIAPAIAHEIKNPKKNLTKALIIAPTIIAGIYLLYYIGLSVFIPKEMVLSGVDPIGLLADKLFGSIGIKIIYIFVIISILGTLNGIILAFIRLPYALAIRNMLPCSKALSKVNDKYDIPINSSLLSLTLTAVYLLLHFLSLDGALVYQISWFKGLEVDNLPIVANFIFLIIVYWAILSNKVHTENPWKAKFYALFAIIGAGIIIYAGFTKPGFNLYLTASILLTLAGRLTKLKKNV